MIFPRLIARQLSQPSGWFGSLILAPLWTRRNAALNNFAFQQLQLRPGDRVLEVGFGGGYLLGRMGGALQAGNLVGADASPSIVASAEKCFRTMIQSGKLELHCASAEALPFPDRYFSKACSVNSIFYWQDAARALGELFRVLENGGLLVLCFTSKKSLAKRGLAGSGITAYETAEVQRMLEEAGFGEILTLSAADRHRQFLCMTAAKQLGSPVTV